MTMDTGAALLAAERFANAFADGEIASEVGTALTCSEVDVLADLFRTFGYDDAADMWIRAHAEGDDEGDQHYEFQNQPTSDDQ
ncbi:Uncharacterised protein [Mycobacteroides abscessus subsp. abscessus]|nr:Uncharacterised protein [Mycobacteroides abscessus subsp. abscessus]SKY69660.1 Uncharacterised protein [Mycobacteroides abscessus subsp. abscessus]